MNEQVSSGLRKRILAEMTVDYTSVLEKNFSLAKQFIRITKTGTVEVLAKDRATGQDQILLYLIGKLYAKEAGLASTDEATNKELIAELGVPEGSLLPWLKRLRDRRRIRTVKRQRIAYHTIAVNLVEKTLSGLDKRMKERT